MLTLRKGDSDNEGIYYGVTLVQELLVVLKELPSHALSGNFDETTRQAVMRFQEKVGLNVDGIVGPKTWQVLGDILLKEINNF
ncbi:MULTISPECIES: peptidoglycan-binding domain-containing protein [Nostocales]|nr:peptidoglycan-binding domain-containing protein [Tolypothrix bouteillei]